MFSLIQATTNNNEFRESGHPAQDPSRSLAFIFFRAPSTGARRSRGRGSCSTAPRPPATGQPADTRERGGLRRGRFVNRGSFGPPCACHAEHATSNHCVRQTFFQTPLASYIFENHPSCKFRNRMLHTTTVLGCCLLLFLGTLGRPTEPNQPNRTEPISLK